VDVGFIGSYRMASPSPPLAKIQCHLDQLKLQIGSEANLCPPLLRPPMAGDRLGRRNRTARSMLMPASGVVGMPGGVAVEDEVVAGHERLSSSEHPQAK
jgi:hypothetical protein